MVQTLNSNLPPCYVYYIKRTGEILSVSNEKVEGYEYELEVSYDDAKGFFSRELQIIDYLVGYKRSADDTTELSIIPKVDEEYAFRNNVYEWIAPSSTSTDVEVEWHLVDRAWYFRVNTQVKELHSYSTLPRNLTFFVTLETDFDFLIRTINVDMQELLVREKIKVPFVSSFEEDITKISIGSRLVFKSYSLKVTHE